MADEYILPHSRQLSRLTRMQLQTLTQRITC